MAFAFPAIDPVAFTIGPKPIYWYGIAYAVSILVGFWYIQRLDNKQEKICSKRFLDDLFFWVVLGIVVGGRLGFVIFYMPADQITFFEIFKIWQGGMSFHGGTIGVIVSLYYLSTKYKLPLLKITDLVACAIPIGLGAGRIGNFINGELFGRVTDVSWAVVFPAGGSMPRHPSQIYEAFTEGVLLWAVLFVATRYFKLYKKSGMLSALFLIGYALSRFVIEFFREPDTHLGLVSLGMTLGQLLTIPMFMAGIYLIWRKMPQYA